MGACWRQTLRRQTHSRSRLKQLRIPDLAKFGPRDVDGGPGTLSIVRSGSRALRSTEICRQAGSHMCSMTRLGAPHGAVGTLNRNERLLRVGDRRRFLVMNATQFCTGGDVFPILQQSRARWTQDALFYAGGGDTPVARLTSSQGSVQWRSSAASADTLTAAVPSTAARCGSQIRLLRAHGRRAEGV